MTHLIINLGNKKIEREAYISYTDNHIVLAFQPKDNMSEISRFITDCLNNGDLLAHPTNPVEGCADANPKTVLPNDT